MSSTSPPFLSTGLIFPGAAVPTHAITMGIGTILESKRIVLLGDVTVLAAV